jgi:hypothetical protein
MTSPRRGRRLLALTYAAILALCTAAGWLLLIGLAAPDTGAWGFRGFEVLIALTFGTVGALIETQVPGHRIGRLFLVAGLLSAVQAGSAEYVIYGGLVQPGSLPFVSEAAWLASWIWVPGVGLVVTYLTLLFPDGRLPSNRWKPAAVFAAISITTTSIAIAFVPGPVQNAVFIDNPFAPTFVDRSTMEVLVELGLFMLSISILLAAAGLLRRFQRSAGVARIQLKWFTFAAGFAGLVLAGPGMLFNLLITGDVTKGLKLFQVLTIVSMLGIPAAAGVAIMRYHLYDIDLILKRSLVYSALTVLLGAMYAGSVVVLQGVLEPFTSGDTLAVAASTLAVAFVFRPVRDRIQGVVDRTFFRSRYDTARTLESFAGEVRDDVDLDLLPARIIGAVSATMQPTHVGLWLRRSPPRS